MIDGGVLAGYLAVAATRGAGRVFDKAVDGLFDRLAQRVAQRLGGQAVAAINARPGDREQQRRVGQGIEAIAGVDGQFAAELADLQRRLDSAVGRQLINTVYAQTSVQAFGGNAYGGGHYEYNVPDPTDYSKAPAWVKVLTVLGIAVTLVGFGLAAVNVLGFITSIPDMTESDRPDFGNFALGFEVSFAGMVILAIAGLGKVMSKKKS
jgi:hypothetical protein